jgi:hypothetical protein
VVVLNIQRRRGQVVCARLGIAIKGHLVEGKPLRTDRVVQGHHYIPPIGQEVVVVVLLQVVARQGEVRGGVEGRTPLDRGSRLELLAQVRLQGLRLQTRMLKSLSVLQASRLGLIVDSVYGRWNWRRLLICQLV